MWRISVSTSLDALGPYFLLLDFFFEELDLFDEEDRLDLELDFFDELFFLAISCRPQPLGRTTAQEGWHQARYTQGARCGRELEQRGRI
jgi:hypothetical protein